MRIRHIPRRIRSLITIFLLTVCTFIIHAHLNEEREKKKSGSDTDKNQTMPFQRLSLRCVEIASNGFFCSFDVSTLFYIFSRAIRCAV